jgi:hypothetical protein
MAADVVNDSDLWVLAGTAFAAGVCERLREDGESSVAEGGRGGGRGKGDAGPIVCAVMEEVNELHSWPTGGCGATDALQRI